MRVVFVQRSIAHLSYHLSTIHVLAAKGHHLHLLFDQGWSEHRRLEDVRAQLNGFGAITVDWLKRSSGRQRMSVFLAREVLTYASYLTRSQQSAYYVQRWRSFLPLLLRWATFLWPVRAILAHPFTQAKLRTYEQSVPPDADIVDWLKSQAPNVVVASPVNMRYSEEVEYVKAAQALGIPTVIPVCSWDNLTTKGLFHIVPTLLPVWNEAHRQEAIDIHKIHSNQIVITGAPFFDKWLHIDRLRESRQSFCVRAGIDPDQPFLLYLGSSSSIAQDETWLLRQLVKRLRTHPNPILREMNVLVRPHPAHTHVYKQTDLPGLSVWPKGGALPEADSTLADLYNSLRHCAVVMGINTSGMIDAVIADRPVLTLITSLYHSTQLQAKHFQHLLKANVMYVAKTLDQCFDYMELLLRGDDPKQKDRCQFVADFIWPHGSEQPAGAIVAEYIEAVARRETLTI